MPQCPYMTLLFRPTFNRSASVPGRCPTQPETAALHANSIRGYNRVGFRRRGYDEGR